MRKLRNSIRGGQTLFTKDPMRGTGPQIITQCLFYIELTFLFHDYYDLSLVTWTTSIKTEFKIKNNFRWF